jgi:hypothetical protein
MRITKAHLQAKVRIINGMLGFDADTVDCRTVGAVELSGAYGGYGVHRVLTTGHAVTDLMGYHGTAREAEKFLSGMIAALRIDREAGDK